MNQLYKRYLLSKTLLMIVFLIFCFFTLYILIDYSLHAQQFMKIQEQSFLKVSKYYLFTIVKRLDIALPLSVLIATTSTLLNLNSNLEIVAFQVGSLKLKKLLKPFFSVALVMTMILYANFEFFLPRSLKYLDTFESKYFKYIKESQFATQGVYVFPLKDSGKMIFSKYNSKDHIYEDVFLYLSNDHLWKIQKLSIKNHQAEGLFAEEFQRDQNNLLQKVNSHKNYIFNDLEIDFSLKKKPIMNYESEKLSTLIQDAFHKSHRYLENQSAIQTHMLLKLYLPWLPFLCVLAICPFCLSFRRDLATFKVYGSSLVLFIFFFTLIDICVILSESASFSPFWTMTLPFLITFSTFSWNYIKKC